MSSGTAAGTPSSSPPFTHRQDAALMAEDPTLRFHIRRYVPDAEGEELTHRVTLLKARDCAAVLRGRTQSWLATECACQAHNVAGCFVFRPHESLARLEVASILCHALVKAAMAADSLDSEETPL
jgi:hypothetical protein